MYTCIHNVVRGVYWRGVPLGDPIPTRCGFVKDKARMLFEEWVCREFASPQDNPILGREGEVECAPGKIRMWDGKDL